MNYCNNILPIYTADFSGQGTSVPFKPGQCYVIS